MVKDVNGLFPYLIDHALNFASAIFILLLGLWLSGKAYHWTATLLRRTPRVDATLEGFFGSLARYFVLGFTVLAVLAKFGVQTTSLVAMIGAAGLAVGLALQGTLSNVAAGVMLLIFRPFRTGQYVEVGGFAGTVKELTLFTTELATPDNVQIIVPNASVWGQAVKNYSFHPTRRTEITYRISYGADIGKAMAELRALIEADARVLKTPEPVIAVTALSDVSVDVLLRIWTASSDMERVKFDLLRAVKERFDANGIEIPTLPHMVKDGEAQAAQH
jgi:small conductance mechanosensitive channel